MTKQEAIDRARLYLKKLQDGDTHGISQTEHWIRKSLKIAGVSLEDIGSSEEAFMAVVRNCYKKFHMARAGYFFARLSHLKKITEENGTFFGNRTLVVTLKTRLCENLLGAGSTFEDIGSSEEEFLEFEALESKASD